MGSPTLSDALAQEAVNVLAKVGGNKTIAAATLGLARSGFQSRIKIAQQRGMTPNAGTPDADDVQGLKAKVKRLESALRSHENQSEQARQIKAATTRRSTGCCTASWPSTSTPTSASRSTFPTARTPTTRCTTTPTCSRMATSSAAVTA